MEQRFRSSLDARHKGALRDRSVADALVHAAGEDDESNRGGLFSAGAATSPS